MSTNSAPPVETIPISRLFCSPTNPRKNDAAIPHVAASLRRFGWQQPIVARRTGEVIAGNTRLKAAQSLGMTEVPVWWSFQDVALFLGGREFRRSSRSPTRATGRSRGSRWPARWIVPRSVDTTCNEPKGGVRHGLRRDGEQEPGDAAAQGNG